MTNDWFRRPAILGALAWFLIPAAGAFAQTPPRVGMVDQPCPPPLALPAGIEDVFIDVFVKPRKLTPADTDRVIKDPRMVEFTKKNAQRARMDWAGLCTYHAANAKALAAPVAPRVVFMGDSITQNWGLADPNFFTNGILDRGISGQTSAQMLVRFRADVVALKPKIVHILAGTNDIAGNTGPESPQDFKNNIMAMVEIAKANNITVLLGGIPPTAHFSWQPNVNPVPWVAMLNGWLRDYAKRMHIQYVDYFSALVGKSGEFRPALSNDGVHPNRDGFAIMRRIVEPMLSGRN